MSMLTRYHATNSLEGHLSAVMPVWWFSLNLDVHEIEPSHGLAVEEPLSAWRKGHLLSVVSLSHGSNMLAVSCAEFCLLIRLLGLSYSGSRLED